MNDKVSIAIRSGLLGGLAYQVFGWVFKQAGLAKITPFEVGAYTLLKPGSDIFSIQAQALGSVQHFANSVLIATMILYIIKLMDSNYTALNGVFAGIIIYFLLYGVIAKLVVPVDILQPDYSTSVVFLFGNIVYGIVANVVLSRYVTHTT